jgi:hypothetical protein
MASSESPAQVGVNGASEKQLSAAQKLMQKHQDEVHKATIEDVPDEEDLRHTPEPLSSSVLESTEDAAPASQWGATMSAKAAGKQKEAPPAKEKAPALDTQSNESFPGLGGAPKPAQPAQARPSWVAKPSPKGANGSPNGTNGLQPRNRASTHLLQLQATRRSKVLQCHLLVIKVPRLWFSRSMRFYRATN